MFELKDYNDTVLFFMKSNLIVQVDLNKNDLCPRLEYV